MAEKESLLVATLIKEGAKITLITHNAKYTLGNGGLINVQKVTDYSTEVQSEIISIAAHASHGEGVYADKDILIQVKYGAKPIETQ